MKAYRPLLLLSYHYWKNVDLLTYLPSVFGKEIPPIILDSGAWSAFTQGKHVDLSAYCDYITHNRKVIRWYSNLDDMVDPKKTLATQKKMEAMGFAPVPVFHTGEDFKFIKNYAKEYPLVAIGKMAPFRRQKNVVSRWIRQCFSMAGSAEIHGFGVSWLNSMKLYPWRSVDSSSWNSAFVFGTVHLWDDVRGHFHIAEASDAREYLEHKKLFVKHGSDTFKIYAGGTRGEIGDALGAINAIGFMNMNAWVRKHFNKKFEYAFAVANKTDLAKIKLALDFVKEIKK